MPHDQHDSAHDDHHGHDQGRFGALRALLYLIKHSRGPGNRLVLERAGIAPGETVLDIGSGPGTAVIEAVKRHRAGLAIGVEPSSLLRRASMIRAAIRGAGGTTDFRSGSAEQIPVGDDTADVVLAVNSMHHWADVDAAIEEIARVLRPGGRFVASDEHFSHPDHPRQDDPHADWPEVDYGRVTALCAELGLAVDVLDDTAGGNPVRAVVARKP